MATEKIFYAPPITKIPFQMAPCDIIIPFHGQEKLVSRLLASIFSTVHTNRYRITLVDDGSPNRAFSQEFDKEKVVGVECLRHEKLVTTSTGERMKPDQCGFGEAIRTAVEHTKQPWIVIMHSDVVCEDMNWLSNLGKTLLELKDSGVKMVSARSDNPMTGDERLMASRQDKDLVFGDVVLTDSFLPMYCSIFHRELLDRIGPIKSYPYAGYEDEEFAWRMKHFGFKQAICGSSWVHHEGGATIAEVGKEKMAAAEMEKNFERCIQDIKSLKKRR